ncbi:MAG: hypothetical protein IT437_12980 [Phycisphaerales bacterium]|nr:hypothetical protein [Phycisphaerales bacterium]
MRKTIGVVALAALCGAAWAGPTGGPNGPKLRRYVPPGVYLPIDGTYSEDFDSYANGSGVIGQGGFQGWGPGALDGVVDNQLSVSAPNSMLAPQAETDVVQDFGVITGGQYVFSVDTYIPSTQVGDGFVILLNQWVSGGAAPTNWSLQIHFNTALITSDFGAQTTPSVLDQWVPLRAEIDLDADLLDVYYNNTQFVFDAIWSQNVSGGGLPQIQALDLYSQAAGFRWDNVSLSPVTAPCYPDCNGDGVLNLSDFGCFTTKFALGDAYADCNGDGIRNLADFGCFTTKFALGCP